MLSDVEFFRLLYRTPHALAVLEACVQPMTLAELTAKWPDDREQIQDTAFVLRLAGYLQGNLDRFQITAETEKKLWTHP
jgi:hypothetical protein